MPSIMIVDDDPLLCEIVRHRLQAVGYAVTVVTDSEAACATASAIAPDLVVLDSMMPVMSGSQVLTGLQRDEATRHIPVIMLTSRKGQDDVVQALRSGAADYLTKPFMPEELVLRIAGQLARRGPDAHAAVA